MYDFNSLIKEKHKKYAVAMPIARTSWNLIKLKKNIKSSVKLMNSTKLASNEFGKNESFSVM